ncbi:MAG: 4Fe-4S dicluster domain-containing protein [bacterium]
MVRYLADIYDAVSSALKGMGITIKHIYKKPVTLQYPDERWVMPERFRGFVYLDTVRCNACQQCAMACPVSCIYIETEGKGKDRYMTRYAIDYNKCIWCSLCTEPCPHAAIYMSHDYDHSLYDRKSLVYEYIPADKPIPTDDEKRKAAGLYVEEKKPKPKPETKEDEPAAPAPAVEKPADEKPAAEKPATEPASESPATDADPDGENSKGESQ